MCIGSGRCGRCRARGARGPHDSRAPGARSGSLPPTTPQHLTTGELEAGLDDIRQSPRNDRVLQTDRAATEAVGRSSPDHRRTEPDAGNSATRAVQRGGLTGADPRGSVCLMSRDPAARDHTCIGYTHGESWRFRDSPVGPSGALLRMAPCPAALPGRGSPGLRTENSTSTTSGVSSFAGRRTGRPA